MKKTNVYPEIKKILITGGTGFIGKQLSHEMLNNFQKYYFPVISSRNLSLKQLSPSNTFILNNKPHLVNWKPILQNCDCIVHFMGQTHASKERSVNSLLELREINISATLSLAEQAIEAGVKRFIFLSSIGVNGNKNSQPFTESDAPNPQNDYAQSKYEAEIQLGKLAKQTNMEIVIIRPPLVYGLNAPGNFGKLVNAINKNTPLPLNNIDNKLSLIALNNLVDFIITCIDHPKAANEIFLVCDDQLTSTTSFIKKIGHALHKKPTFFPFPKKAIIAILTLIGKKDTAVSLFDSLQIDNSKAKKLLGWSPKITMEEQLKSPL